MEKLQQLNLRCHSLLQYF